MKPEFFGFASRLMLAFASSLVLISCQSEVSMTSSSGRTKAKAESKESATREEVSDTPAEEPKAPDVETPQVVTSTASPVSPEPVSKSFRIDQNRSATVSLTRAVVQRHEELKVLEGTYFPFTKSIKVNAPAPDSTTGTALFFQTNRGRLQSDKGTLIDPNKIDLAIVIDNSSSIADEQAKLKDALVALVEGLSGKDWRMAITTTDPAGPCSTAILEAGDSAAAVAAAALVGTGGSNEEAPIFKMQNLLEGDCAGFSPRPDAFLATVILTNEDDCSDGNSCADNVPNARSFGKIIKDTRTADSGTNVSIAWQKGTSCSKGLYPAVRLDQEYATYALPVLRASICDSSFLGVKDHILNAFASKPNSLKLPAATMDPATLKVVVNGVQLPAEAFHLEGDRLTVSATPLGSRFVVSWRMTGPEPRLLHTGDACNSFLSQHDAYVTYFRDSGTQTVRTGFVTDFAACTFRLNVLPTVAYAVKIVGTKGPSGDPEPFSLNEIASPIGVDLTSLQVTYNGAALSFELDADRDVLKLTPAITVPGKNIVLTGVATNDPQLAFPYSSKHGGTLKEIVDEGDRKALVAEISTNGFVLGRYEARPGRRILLVEEATTLASRQAVELPNSLYPALASKLEQVCGNAVAFDQDAKAFEPSRCSTPELTFAISVSGREMVRAVDISELLATCSGVCTWTATNNGKAITSQLDGANLRFSNDLEDGEVTVVGTPVTK